VSFVVVATWVAREGEEERVAGAIEQLTGPSRAESGCLTYQAQRSLEEPRSFLLYEVYESREAYEEHLASDHFRRFATELGIPLLERRERRFYETFPD
jgi:quinol monooxygenase YgiN